MEALNSIPGMDGLTSFLQEPSFQSFPFYSFFENVDIQLEEFFQSILDPSIPVFGNRFNFFGAAQTMFSFFLVWLFALQRIGVLPDIPVLRRSDVRRSSKNDILQRRIKLQEKKLEALSQKHPSKQHRIVKPTERQFALQLYPTNRNVPPKIKIPTHVLRRFQQHPYNKQFRGEHVTRNFQAKQSSRKALHDNDSYYQVLQPATNKNNMENTQENEVTGLSRSQVPLVLKLSKENKSIRTSDIWKKYRPEYPHRRLRKRDVNQDWSGILDLLLDAYDKWAPSS